MAKPLTPTQETRYSNRAEFEAAMERLIIRTEMRRQFFSVTYYSFKDGAFKTMQCAAPYLCQKRTHDAHASGEVKRTPERDEVKAGHIRLTPRGFGRNGITAGCKEPAKACVLRVVVAGHAHYCEVSESAMIRE